MTTLAVRNNNLPQISREEFLSPFDSFFNDVLNTHFPHFSKEFGDDLFTKGAYPKVDIVDNGTFMSIEAEVPGLTKEDISLNVQSGKVLVISGNTKKIDEKKDKTYVRRELKRSSFKRSFTLGENLDPNSIKADFKDGILNITINKVKSSEPEIKTITIN